jgi:glycolate oxidase
MNAGGANAIKYGVMRNYVKGIELALSSGEVLELGGKLLKNNVGYDLMQLIIGSEGTLGIVTKVIIRLFPKFQATAILIVPYDSRHDAVNTVPKILQDGRLPLAIEYAEKDLLVKTAEAIGEVWPANQGSCYLLITMAEANRDVVLSESARVAEICQENRCLEPLFAEPLDEQRKIVRIRSNIYFCLKQDTADILDVTVPPANIGKLLDAVDAIAEKYSAHLLSYGHVGDGNLHIHIIKNAEKSIDHIENLRNDIYEATVKLEGVITGEHGIGRTRVAYVNRFVNEKYLDLMKKIKRIFDPENILNPDVKLPS